MLFVWMLSSIIELLDIPLKKGFEKCIIALLIHYSNSKQHDFFLSFRYCNKSIELETYLRLRSRVDFFSVEYVWDYFVLILTCINLDRKCNYVL